MTKYENKINDIFNNSFNLTNDEIEELLKLIIYDKELNEYVDTICFEDGKIYNLAMYLVNAKKILINDKYIDYLFNNWYRSLGLPFDDKLMHEFYKIYLVLMCLHETNHVSQVKESNNREEDSIAKILNEGIELGRRSPDNLTIRERLIYRYAQSYIPTEKNAEINALFELISIARQNKILSNIALNYLYNQLLYHLIKGYNTSKNTCPTEIYYKLRGKSKEFEDISFDENYYTLTKLSYGIPINKDVISDIRLVKRTREYEKIHTII